MDTSSLIAVGLTPSQASAYALLIEHGSLKPPEAAKLLGTTRSNAYKVLDKLVELQLAVKTDEHKKIVYTVTNPIALSSITSNFRAEATAREEAANRVMHDLLAKFYARSDKPDVTVVSGRQAVADAYRKQINLKEDIHFINTRTDVSAMGFDVMHELRTAPTRHGNRRQAIMTAPSTPGPINYEAHKRSNLEITWAKDNDYTAPVEWSVTASSLLIVLYADEPHAILIVDPIVASAFMQLWKLLSGLLQQQPTHQAHKPKD